MSDNIKLDSTGLCSLCNGVANASEQVQCSTCNNHFHVSCSSLQPGDRAATKTTVNAFNLNSTKKNFMFLCDCCLTRFELSLADTEAQRVNVFENKIANIESQLGDIKDLLTNKQNDQPAAKKSTGNAWVDKEN